MIPPVRARGDHPRVCGEHKVDDSTGEGAWGSSPRMRGTLRRAFRKFRRLGIIPAYAGNTQPVSPCRQCNRDHPRVCGEHDPLVPSVCDVLGSSPRMRGTLGRRVVGLCLVGIIPAYAGNTDQSIILFPSCGDHPRVCGEHYQLRGCRNRSRDHPRVCGEHATGASTQVNCTGSSPRMRGTPAVTEATNNTARIIPAYAGNTPAACWKSWQAWDHPRVCGEHINGHYLLQPGQGSSPRMRGTHQKRRAIRREGGGIIPAYAGNTPIRSCACL